ncbi:insulinase family protein [Yoonia sp.]|uniref:insulinase family protein n=1 Tax=Yoonia sp. TaxID=2212373 RepID=UPI002E00B33D|nr:insulinase family protein [Yoonia sp.]
MIRTLTFVAAFFALAACQDGTLQATSQTSPGGTAYTLITMPDTEDVSIHVAWSSDWGYRADTNKAAPYIGMQLILMGGAEGFEAGEVGELFADMNSEGDIYGAANDNVIGELTFARDQIDRTIEIANAHLRAPALDQVWFERIRDDLTESMTAAQAQAAHASFDAARWAVFGEAPMRNALSLDDPATFSDVSRADIVAWHQSTITRTPEAIVVTGAIDADAAGAAIDALLTGLPEAAPQLPREISINLSPRRILLHMPDATVTNLAFIARLPPTSQGGEIEDLILVHALGGDDQSVLFDAVRTQLRATYGFGAGMANYSRNHRILFMTGEVEDAKLADAAQVVRDAYADFKQTGPEGELADRKQPLNTSFTGLSEFVIDLARSEIQSALDGFPVGRSLALVEELAEVSDTDIMNRLTDDFPGPDDFIVIAVSPNADALPGACVITTPSQAAGCP